MDYSHSIPFDFIKDRSEIFKALLDSKERGTAIGIKSAELGQGICVTAIEDILLGDGYENTRIILKGYDFTGQVLECNVVLFTDIEGICRFSSKFGNPILKALSKLMKI